MARKTIKRPFRATVGPVHAGVFKLFNRVLGGSYEPRTPQAYMYESIRASYDIEKDGIQQLMAQVNKLVSHLETQAEFVVYEALRPTFELSQSYVPVDTGDLKRSGVLEMRVRGKRKEHVCEIGYGRSGQPFYTTFVHENMEVGHLAPTSAKFLARALMEDMPNIERRVIEFTKIIFGVA